ncbi:casparian strip membrane protein 5-like [Gastrolobium bilobum]|uniref:casparian strip membrane protein 5-like n=1 Tax=Gastrolobium bilobum TaxID=150636 RepID=UPI002AAFEA7A|nr:casparian strip membrane protein 5-like [Gastrolobium bilobum]
MESGKKGEATTVTIHEKKNTSKGKGVTWDVPHSADSVSTKTGSHPRPAGWKKGIAIADFVLRLGAIGAAIGSAVIMGTNEEQLPFFTQFLQFHAEWNDFPIFQFLVVANGIISGYLILSLPFSFVCIVRPHAVGPRLLLITLDIVMMGLITASASSAAAIVYLAHNGSQEANWIAICQGYTNFCQAASEAVVISFLAAIFFVCLVSLSAFALIRN